MGGEKSGDVKGRVWDDGYTEGVWLMGRVLCACVGKD